MPTTTWNLLGNTANAPGSYLGTTDAQPVMVKTGNTERMIVDMHGNVGVGTHTPQEKLQVEGGSVLVDGEGGGVIVDAAGLERVGLMKYAGYEGALVGSTQLATPVRLGRWEGGTIKAPGQVHIDVVVTANGNVGVGTTGPQGKLGIAAGGTATAVYASSPQGIAVQAAAQSNTGVFATSNTGMAIDARSATNIGVRATSESGSGIFSSSNTGIGVDGRSTGGIAIQAVSQSNTGIFATSTSGMGGDLRSNSGIGLQAVSQTNTAVFAISTSGLGLDARSAQSIAVRASAVSDTAVFATSTDGTGVDTRSTNGIGVYAEGGKFAGYFRGNIAVTGDVLLTGADCAEHFDVVCSEEPPAAGTVVVIDEEGHLKESCEPYDRKVAGVVSGAGEYRPAIVLDNRASAGHRVPVALVGKVYCKVDAQYAAIAVGDLLTSSPTPGHAMKASESSRSFGAILGKALRPLAGGTGLIPVLVSLQ